MNESVVAIASSAAVSSSSFGRPERLASFTEPAARNFADNLLMVFDEQTLRTPVSRL